MSNDPVDCIDVQNLTTNMATVTTSSSTVNTIQNSIKEHVLNSELTNFVTNGKLNETEANLTESINNTSNCYDSYDITDSSSLNEKLNGLLVTKNDLFGKLTDQNSLNSIKQSLGTKQTSTNVLLDNDEDELILITNPSTINFLRDSLNLIKSDLFRKTIRTDLNQNTLTTTNTDLDSPARQLTEIFSSIRESISTNPKLTTDFHFLTSSDSKINSSTSMTKLLIEKNKLFDKFYSSTGDRLNGDLIDDTAMSNQLNNNDGQCILQECNQFNTNNHNQISKLIADDYLSEHDYSYLTNTNLQPSSNQTNSIKQISPMMNPHNPHNQTKIRKNCSLPDDEDDEEIYEDVNDNSIIDYNEQSTNEKIKQPNRNSSDPIDVETMKNHLAKLKDFDNVNVNNLNNFSNSPLDELYDDNDFFDAIDDDDDEIDRAPLIRSTSLKTGKSKNLSTDRKIVRFADAMGLDLAKIKRISQEDLPNVPASAFKDLKMCKKEIKEEFFNNQLSCSPVRTGFWNQNAKSMNSNNSTFSNKTPVILSNGFMSAGLDLVTPGGNWPVLVPEFVQPFTQFNFLERVRNQKVSLESCVVSSIGNNLSVDCIIRVQNISFEKLIMVRYTNNNWLTWLDSLASYIPNSCDNETQTDKFSVKFYIKSLAQGQRVKFAIKYLANAQEYWDNNLGIDYCLLYKA